MKPRQLAEETLRRTGVSVEADLARALIAALDRAEAAEKKVRLFLLRERS